jgi:hypothetical protein
MRELEGNDLEAIKAVHWWHRIPVGLISEKVFHTPADVTHGDDSSDYAIGRFGLLLDLNGKRFWNLAHGRVRNW